MRHQEQSRYTYPENSVCEHPGPVPRPHDIDLFLCPDREDPLCALTIPRRGRAGEQPGPPHQLVRGREDEVRRQDRQARHDEQAAGDVEVVAVLLPDPLPDRRGVLRPLLGARADDGEDGRRDERREGQGGEGQDHAGGRAGERGRDPHPEEDQDPDRAEVEHVLILGALFRTLGVSVVLGFQTTIKGNSPDLRNEQKKLRKSAAMPTRT